MTLKRVYLGLSAAQLKTLKGLSVKLGLDLTNTLRYCVARIAEQEGLGHEKGAKGVENRPN